jgi:hypothetical protein
LVFLSNYRQFWGISVLFDISDVAGGIIALSIESNLSQEGNKGTWMEVIRDSINLASNIFRSGKWRAEESYFTPYSKTGIGVVFLSVAVCGLIVPILISIMT